MEPRKTFQELEDTPNTSYPKSLYPESLEQYIDEVSERAARLYKFLIVPRGATPETLWHYTSTKAFFEILETNTIHLGDAAYMNDPTEGIIFHEDLQEAVDLIGHEDIKALGPKKDPVYDFISDPGFRMRLMHSFVDRFFILSLSEDNNSLDQWRIYGDDARGVAIGFDSGLLQSHWASVHRADLLKITYDRKQRHELIGEVTQLYVQYKDSAHALFGNSPPRGLMTALGHLRGEIFALLDKFRYAIKHEGYRSEVEWRLCVHVRTDPMRPQQFLYLARRNTVSEVLSINGGHFKQGFLPISQLAWGPLHNKVPSERFVASYAGRYGPIGMSQSDLPYRGKAS